MQHLAADTWPAGHRSMSDIQHLARRIVSGNPSVEGVVLFGSRARDTARDDSDWDVALLAPDGCGKDVVRTAPHVPNVNYAFLSPKKLRDKAHLLGTLEKSVAQDGILLEGKWSRPKSRKRQRVSYPNLYHGLQSAAVGIEIAVYRLLRSLEYPIDPVDATMSRYTHEAAEYLSKAALLHLAIHPEFTHNFTELADALRKRRPRHAWIGAIESFDGQSTYRKSAAYYPDEDELIEESADKLCRVVEFYNVVLFEITQQRTGFYAYLEKLGREISGGVSVAKHYKCWKIIPDDLKKQLLQWNRLATDLLTEMRLEETRTQFLRKYFHRCSIPSGSK